MKRAAVRVALAALAAQQDLIAMHVNQRAKPLFALAVGGRSVDKMDAEL